MLSQSGLHTRPISGLQFSPDGRLLASASWDRQVTLRSLKSERDTRTFFAHDDIVSGCRFTPDGRSLLTWSHDSTVGLWDVASSREILRFREHKERVTSADVSPDGRWIIAGSRNGDLLLWDLEARSPAGSLALGAEARGCCFLLDGQSVALADANGEVILLSLPDLREKRLFTLHQPVQCAALSPNGQQLALGCDDGVVRLVIFEGGVEQPLIVTATQSTRVTATGLQKFFGRSSTTQVYTCTCPACRHTVERVGSLPQDLSPCPHCKRHLRYNVRTLVAEAAC
jgi:WD40 repeat protein